MSILEDLTSGDAHRIWEGACAVRDLRDRSMLLQLSSHVDEVRAKTAGVQLGGALRPNSTHLLFALRKLQFVKESSDCLCLLYGDDDLCDPNREAKAGTIRILKEIFKDRWIDFYLCECLSCGRQYRVEEREYHYTWWKWEKAEP